MSLSMDRLRQAFLNMTNIITRGGILRDMWNCSRTRGEVPQSQNVRFSRDYYYQSDVDFFVGEEDLKKIAINGLRIF